MKIKFLTNLFRKSTAGRIATQTKNEKSNEHLDAEGSKALIESGKSKAKTKNYHGAIDDFTKAIALDPTSMDAYFERSKAKREINDINGGLKDLDEGKRLLDNLDSGLKAKDEADAYYNSDDYKNAIRCYNKAIPLIPTITSMYYYRGDSKLRLDDYMGAVEDFNKSIESDSLNKASALYQRSKIKSHKLNDTAGALEDLNMAIEINPNDSDYYYSRSILLDDYDALQDLNKAVDLAPTDADNLIARALKRSAMNDFEGSISDLTRYIGLGPEHSLLTVSEAYSLRAGMRTYQNDIQGALKDHDQAVEADQSNQKAYVERGLIKTCLRDSEGAISDFNWAIGLDPEYADAYYHRGLTKRDIGLENEGLADIMKAKALGYQE